MAFKPIQILIQAKDEASSALQRLIERFRGVESSSRDAGKGVAGLGSASEAAAAGLARAGGLLAGAFSAERFVGIIAEQQQLALSFEAIFGGAERAAQEMEFVRSAANRLGVESSVLARSYQSLAAATKGTALEGEQTRAVFEATARAMAVLGKSSAQTDQALTAIAQMASKGTVSMEELRGQLGEALPGALQATAKGAGVTTEQLIGMVESGQVLAKDLLPALAQGLNDLYEKAAPPQTIISEWARLKNVITDTATAVGEGGASQGLAKGLAWVALGVRGVSNAADVAGTAIGEFAAAVRTGNFDLQQAAALNAKYDAELRKAAEDAGLIAKSQAAVTQATQAQVRAVDNAVAAQQRQVTSTLAVRAAYAELAKGSKDYADLAAKVSAARQAEASLLTGLVGVYGTEQERRQAAAEAADMQARSLKDLADARNVEAVVAQSYAIRLKEEALKRNDNSEATRKEIDAAQKSAAAKRAEADQANAIAQGKAVEVAAAQAAAAAYEDNANKVYQLRGAAADAAREVERLVALEKQGKATGDQVTAARAEAAKAIALYRDALNDASAAAERELDSARRTAQVVQGAISVDLERANAMREVAEASGDLAGAEAARQAATSAQIRAAQESAKAARDEAAAMRAVANSKEAELRATGQLTAEKKAELDAMRRSADLKDQEAQKADILASKLLSLANSEQARTDALERHISAQEKALELEERRIALENKRLGRDKNGFSTDKVGQTINAGGATLTSVYEFLKGAGVSDEAAARRIAKEFADNQGNIQFFNNPGQKKYGGSTLSDALLKAAERVTFAEHPAPEAKAPGAVPSPASGTEPTARTAAPPAVTQTYRINLVDSKGGTHSFDTDAPGASAVGGFLAELERSRAVSSAR